VRPGSTITAVIALLATVLLAVGCGSDDTSSGGAKTINLWVFNEPSGSFTNAAKRCSDASDGRYVIKYNALSNNADQQRQSLVRRLAAEDESIDIMGMDVIWTAEFAEAEWLKEWTGSNAEEIRRGTLRGPLETATYQNRLWAAPANTNTQLLWYRKDLVSEPAQTWDGLIEQAEGLQEGGTIQVQGAQYEGVVVWFNSLVQSAGGTIIENNEETPSESWQRAAEIMKKLADSDAADPSISASKEDQARAAFESGDSAFQINYPFVYPSAKEGNPEVYKNMGWKPYPRVEAGTPSKAPIGGINWGVSAYSPNPEEAFDAAACLRNEENQREAAIKGGLPPTLSSLYDDASFKKDYPFAKEIRDSVDTGAVRPQTPAYADVSLAIAKTVSPPSGIVLDGFVEDLTTKLDDALQSKGLI
jgi:ABC-type glycerol-3-phosphate transport system substrate-binding protein